MADNNYGKRAVIGLLKGIARDGQNEDNRLRAIELIIALGGWLGKKPIEPLTRNALNLLGMKV